MQIDTTACDVRYDIKCLGKTTSNAIFRVVDCSVHFGSEKQSKSYVTYREELVLINYLLSLNNILACIFVKYDLMVWTMDCTSEEVTGIHFENGRANANSNSETYPISR